jgi:23S rRNA-intervening sequence protein
MKRMPARSFRDLIVWQKAHQFALAVYRLTRSFLKEETYGLTSQFRRADCYNRSILMTDRVESCELLTSNF